MGEGIIQLLYIRSVLLWSEDPEGVGGDGDNDEDADDGVAVVC